MRPGIVGLLGLSSALFCATDAHAAEPALREFELAEGVRLSVAFTPSAYSRIACAVGLSQRLSMPVTLWKTQIVLENRSGRLVTFDASPAVALNIDVQEPEYACSRLEGIFDHLDTYGVPVTTHDFSYRKPDAFLADGAVRSQVFFVATVGDQAPRVNGLRLSGVEPAPQQGARDAREARLRELEAAYAEALARRERERQEDRVEDLLLGVIAGLAQLDDSDDDAAVGWPERRPGGVTTLPERPAGIAQGSCASSRFALPAAWGDGGAPAALFTRDRVELAYLGDPATLCLEVPTIHVDAAGSVSQRAERFQFSCASRGYGASRRFEFDFVQRIWLQDADNCDGYIVPARTANGDALLIDRRQGQASRVDWGDSTPTGRPVTMPLDPIETRPPAAGTPGSREPYCTATRFELENEWQPGDSVALVYTPRPYTLAHLDGSICLDVPAVTMRNGQRTRRRTERFQFHCSSTGFGAQRRYRFNMVQRMWHRDDGNCDGNIVEARTDDGQPLVFR